MQNNNKSETNNTKTGINGTELVINNKKQCKNTKVIKWIKIKSDDSNSFHWEPIFIVRSSAPNRKDCKLFIGKSVNNKYRTYDIDELYNYRDIKSKGSIINTMMKSLYTLFNQTTINEDASTPIYLYQNATDSDSIFSSLNIFNNNNNNNNELSLYPVNECELHESSGIDEFDRDVTGIWISTDNIREKTYMSIEKIKTIHYIDDVNPVQCDKKNDNISRGIKGDWQMIDEDGKEWEEWEEYEEDNKYKQEAEELKLQRSSSLKLIEDLKAENNGKQQENDQLSLEMNQLKQKLNKTQRNQNEARLNEMILEQKRNLDDKQKEIDRLRRELIARSNAKQLNSKFPTVEEVCTEYRSIKNQEFQSVHSKLSKPIRKKHKDWNKHYINKLSHKLLFKTLIKCYNDSLFYHDNIYKSIGDILQISYIDNNNNDNDNNDNNNNALEFLFHRYLTNNYETMKESEEFKEIKNEKILKECLNAYNDIINILSNDEKEELINSLKIFINKCCDVCWSMILQRPKLTISPSQFIPNNKIAFDENKQTRILGSNKKDKYILYYVWPGIAQNNVQLDNVKIYVVQRDNDFNKTNK